MSDLQPIYRKDYREPDYWIEEVELWFLLEETGATVTSKLNCRRHANADPAADLVLDGEHLELLSVVLDGEPLASEQYRVSDQHLTVAAPGESFTLEIQVRNHPQQNTSMEGLYQSSGNFCTQCEAEGFRRITYFLDRPDVMARYTTTIEADAEKYPVLLCNGNRVSEGAAEQNRHWVKWEDPFPKPSYLFALVAGSLSCHRGQFTTSSGRTVHLEIWVEPQNIDACEHALVSLQKSMKWDEDVFGLEYDLDLYMIVAVSDFNMGAMENKGLNIFNTKYVLARPDTATDVDYEQVERVVAHEYFHNWTGNRVTCRDWFQLTLKEGLTVFRDQLFSSDMGSADVNRIRDVRTLRARQFAEDDGPMAHPIRPESYVEMNNFYTVTVYNKGAEVIRMYYTMLGKEGFRKGMDLYFQRHDGSAVECDDFLAAMADANQVDLSQFARWYSQAGTPVVAASGAYDQAAGAYVLKLTQTCRPTHGLPDPEPFHMPVRVGLVGADGEDIHAVCDGVSATEHLLHLRQAEQTFQFASVEQEPTPSLFRGFSAPIRLKTERSKEQLAFLFANDRDAFNRWDAGQELAERLLLQLVDQVGSGSEMVLDSLIVDAIGKVLDSSLDGSMKALAVSMPDEAWLGHQMEVVLVEAIHAAREFAIGRIAAGLNQQWRALYSRHHGVAYANDQASIANRSIKNAALQYICRLEGGDGVQLAVQQFTSANNMTDAQVALSCLSDIDCPERVEAFQSFYDRWRHDPLVMDKWFAIRAGSKLSSVLEDVRSLLRHRDFNRENPNRVRSLLGAFCNNRVHFHRADGEGYQLVADHVLELDSINAQVAAMLVSSFTSWRRFDAGRQALIVEQLERISKKPGLSKDVGEIVGRSLDD